MINGSLIYRVRTTRPVIKENDARVVAKRQNKVIMLWRAILNRTP